MEGELPGIAESVWSDGQLYAEHLGLSACNLLATEVTLWFSRTGEMAQWVEVSATRPDGLNLIPHGEGEH